MLVVNVSSLATPGNALPRSTGAIRRCPSDPTLSPNERAVYEYTLTQPLAISAIISG